MLAELPRQPGNSWLHSSLALAYAFLGDKEQALHHARRATEIRPESRDVIYGTGNAVGYASVLAWVGEKDRAIAEVARLLRIPYGVNVRAARNGAGNHWGGSLKPLLDDPRFQALLADPANNAPLF
jgi:hypothetical protein